RRPVGLLEGDRGLQAGDRIHAGSLPMAHEKPPIGRPPPAAGPRYDFGMTSTDPNPSASRRPEGLGGLRRLIHRVTAAGFGDATELRAGTLSASKPELEALMADPALAAVRL